VTKVNNFKNLEIVNSGWTERVVMICSRCGEQFKSTLDKNSPEKIKSDLKNWAKANLPQGSTRVITTSCLNICPENKIAITICDKSRPHIFDSVAVAPDIDVSDLAKSLIVR
jgi:hypothetical protein